MLAGSNLGDRMKMLRQTQLRCAQMLGSCLAASGIYETEPWGKTDQALFLNQAWLMETEIQNPLEWLSILKNIEKESGRATAEKWGPRLIDIDILLAEQIVFENEHLQIPHPALPERRFALLPACEITADWMHPVLGVSLKHLLDICPDPLNLYQLKEDGAHAV